MSDNLFYHCIHGARPFNNNLWLPWLRCDIPTMVWTFLSCSCGLKNYKDCLNISNLQWNYFKCRISLNIVRITSGSVFWAGAIDLSNVDYFRPFCKNLTRNWEEEHVLLITFQSRRYFFPSWREMLAVSAPARIKLDYPGGGAVPEVRIKLVANYTKAVHETFV